MSLKADLEALLERIDEAMNDPATTAEVRSKLASRRRRTRARLHQLYGR